MRKAKKWLWLLLVLLLLAMSTVIAYLVSLHANSEVGKHHVYVMFSESKDIYSFTDCEKSVKDAFEKSLQNVEIRFGYLECDKYDEESEIEHAGSLLREARKKGKIDVVITVGDQATYSLLKSGEAKGMPVVFSSVQFPNMSLINEHGMTTGVADSIDFITNIKLAKKITDTGNTFTTIDKSFLDRKVRALAQEQLARHKEVLNNLDWDLSIHELLNTNKNGLSLTPMSLRYLGENTKKDSPMDQFESGNLVLSVRRFTDLTYIQTRFAATTVNMVRFSNNRPKITAVAMDFGRINTDYVAGYFSSVEDIASATANYATKVLMGTEPEKLPIKSAPKHYYVDWAVAKHFKIPLSRFPEYATIINMAWYERHPLLFWGLLIVSIILLVLTVVFYLKLLVRERKQKRSALEAVQKENMLFSMAVQNSLTFAWERDVDKIYLNDAFWKHYGQEPRVITVQEFTEMIHPNSREVYMDNVKKVNRGDAVQAEIQADFYQNGEYHWYLIRGNGVFDSNHNYIRSFGMIMKIDELKEREKELVEARRLAEEATLKESFLANMSHEIRTPLNAIVGFSDLLIQQGDELSHQEKQMFSDTIHTNNDLLLKLINDILDVSRIESGEMDFVIRNYKVSDIMDKVYQTFSLLIPKHLKFCYQKDDDAAIEVDEGRIRQVITNFLTNAAKFTPQGRITMGWTLDREQKKVKMYVEDTGIGLSEEDRKMVFSRFYKKDEFKQGTGLGLSICKAIVIRLGGKVKVESQQGKGSCFYVLLPYTD